MATDNNVNEFENGNENEANNEVNNEVNEASNTAKTISNNANENQVNTESAKVSAQELFRQIRNNMQNPQKNEKKEVVEPEPKENPKPKFSAPPIPGMNSNSKQQNTNDAPKLTKEELEAKELADAKAALERLKNIHSGTTEERRDRLKLINHYQGIVDKHKSSDELLKESLELAEKARRESQEREKRARELKELEELAKNGSVAENAPNEPKKSEMAEQLKRQRPVLSRNLQSFLDEDDDIEQEKAIPDANDKKKVATEREVEDPMAELKATILNDATKEQPERQGLSKEDRERFIVQKNNLLALEHEVLTDKEEAILSSVSTAKPLTREESKQLDEMVVQAKEDELKEQADIAVANQNVNRNISMPLPNVKLEEENPDNAEPQKPSISEQLKSQRPVLSSNLQSFLDEDDDIEQEKAIPDANDKKEVATEREVEDPMAELKATMLKDATKKQPKHKGLSQEDRERLIAQIDNVLALEHEVLTDKEEEILSSVSTSKPLTREETQRLDEMVAQAKEDELNEQADIAVANPNVNRNISMPLPDVELDEEEVTTEAKEEPIGFMRSKVLLDDGEDVKTEAKEEAIGFMRSKVLLDDGEDVDSQINIAHEINADNHVTNDTDLLQESLAALNPQENEKVAGVDAENKVENIEQKQNADNLRVTKPVNDESRVAVYEERLKAYNNMYKLNVDSNNFAASVTEAWELMTSGDKQKMDDGQKVLQNLFGDTLKKAFDVEKDSAYQEHRLPEYIEIVRSTNELLRSAMYGLTDVYHDPSRKDLFAATAFGGCNAKDIGELTASNSFWSMDQKSDEAWDIQSQEAKNIADKWLKEDKPYEKMINEMNALAKDYKKDNFDSREVYNKLIAAEWLLFNNEKMLVENPEDPLNPIPNWGNRYWKAIVNAREALGIPKHTPMRELIQSDYAESAKAVENRVYNERQIFDGVLDPADREMHDSLDVQKETFTVRSRDIVIKEPPKENENDKTVETHQNEIRWREPVESQNEREKMKNEPKVFSNMVVQRTNELQIDAAREDFR